MVNIMRNAGGNGKKIEVVQPDATALDAEGYVGVDPIYQNFANDVDKPYKEGEPGETEEIAAKHNLGEDTGKTDEGTAPATVPTETKAEGDEDKTETKSVDSAPADAKTAGDTSGTAPTAKPATKAGTPKASTEPKI